MRSLVVLVTAAAVSLTLSVPAAATPALRKWRAVHSADGMASAWGEVAIHQFGHLVTGNLEDTRGKGCAWAVLRSQGSRDGRWRDHGFYNCVPGVGTFRKDYRDARQVKVRVCRGTAQRPTGGCSAWKTILRPGQ
ncbi:hypothetical protein GCM10009850_077720 [Nonomuraea monospora]|uniref:Secreted protein n=1 Tax=Nonomuraea monospora TaxID=568818 RepID=A0ABN3CS83_9ACTN